MQVAVDTDKIAGRKLSDIDDIQSIMQKTEEEAAAEIKEEDSTLTLGAIGSPYMVGPIDCMVAIGNLVLLNEIDSPFITGDIGEIGSELDATECIKSLYVLANGKKAVKPVMAIKQRVQSLLLLKPVVEKDPSLFESLMDRAESISQAHVDFELKAVDWYNEHFTGADFQSVLNDVFAILGDVTKVSKDLPSSDEKKK